MAGMFLGSDECGVAFTYRRRRGLFLTLALNKVVFVFDPASLCLEHDTRSLTVSLIQPRGAGWKGGGSSWLAGSRLLLNTSKFD